VVQNRPRECSYSGKSLKKNDDIPLTHHSDCGYDHRVAGTSKRHTAVDFTGCLAHAEITHLVATQQILRIRGYFEHNDGCKEALLARIPALPLHPKVFQIAILQLADGASITDIQARNRALIKSGGYGLKSSNPRELQYRLLLGRSDTRSLYRQFSRIRGVRVTEKPHVNIHEWLNPASPRYNCMLAHAVFHYQARAEKGERLEVCVAIDEMKEAAWKYAHLSQVILDGTFGVCDRRLLLFIVMAIDEDRRGIPLAFLFFSAPSGNKQTAAGYDTRIITKLIHRWKDALEQFQTGKPFRPLVAITDTDLKERAALLEVFPSITLLLCKFHLRQSWRNHRNKVLKGKSPAFIQLKSRMQRIEESLVSTVVHENAMQIVLDEVKTLELMKGTAHEVAAERGLQHLHYLSSYWLSKDLWASWSDFARHSAAQVLGCAFEGVLPTTNHLEAFNGLLKRKHLRRFQRGGRRLRLDVLVKLIAFDILPSIFEQRRMEREEKEKVQLWMKSLPGGDRLSAVKTKPSLSRSAVAWLFPDQKRDAEAAEILKTGQISAPTLSQPHENGFSFNCYSSLALDLESNTTMYEIHINFNRLASCSCPDFIKRGGACKHLRAAILKMGALRAKGIQIPHIQLPSTEDEAQSLHLQFNLPPSESLGEQVLALQPPTLPPAIRAAQLVDDVLQDDHTIFSTDGDESDECEESSCEEADSSIATDEEDEFDFVGVYFMQAL
jgi:hypothetical protein